MRKLTFHVPFYLPEAMYRALRRLKRKQPSSQINLLGDRDIEWSWVASKIPTGAGEALDFGNGGSFLGLIAANKGFNVTAVDLGAVKWPYRHQLLRFVQGDILKLELPANFYNLVLNCSTIEHVGLAGRYDVTSNLPDGDLEAMARLHELLKKGGMMLLTIPMGQDAVFSPICRVYGEKRLPSLLAGFALKEEEFWVKNNQNLWIRSDRATAMRFPSSAGSWKAMKNITALGCFVLEKPL